MNRYYNIIKKQEPKKSSLKKIPREVIINSYKRQFKRPN
jgi:hypothetical protein